MSSVSPTNQDLSNDTIFSQIKSRVPVPLNNSELKSKTQDIYIHLISIFFFITIFTYISRKKHQEVHVNILFSPEIIKKMKIIGKVFLLDMASLKLKHVFIVVGWWITIDFDSQCKIFLGETRANGVPIHEKGNVQNQNLHNCSHPLYQNDACWGGGLQYSK